MLTFSPLTDLGDCFRCLNKRVCASLQLAGSGSRMILQSSGCGGEERGGGGGGGGGEGGGGGGGGGGEGGGGGGREVQTA